MEAEANSADEILRGGFQSNNNSNNNNNNDNNNSNNTGSQTSTGKARELEERGESKSIK